MRKLCKKNCVVKLNVFIDALTNEMEDGNECKGGNGIFDLILPFAVCLKWEKDEMCRNK